MVKKDESKYHIVERTHAEIDAAIRYHDPDGRSSNDQDRLGEAASIFLMRASPAAHVLQAGRRRFGCGEGVNSSLAA